MKVFLYSTSPRRAEVLRLIGCDFIIKEPLGDERGISKTLSPEDYVIKSSLVKLGNREKIKDSGLCISADTIVFFNGQYLEKPDNENEAFLMLEALSGHWHHVYTGMTLFNSIDRSLFSFSEITEVSFRHFNSEFIKSYLSTGEPFDKAGAYGIQGYGASLIKEIKGCYYNVMGFPLAKFLDVIEERNFRISLFKRRI
ncbi:MAG: septum formation protein Maf [Candidatus Coatesbacteria bacterium]|nr:septum formation protein Maf [Candidatus Coatesbacteria bacterium]